MMTASRKKILIIVIFALAGAIAIFFFGQNSQITEKIEEKIFDFAGRKNIRGRNFYIRPQGNDAQDGLSFDAPLKTIQKAIDQAEPGDTINLEDGIYMQDFVSKKDGKKNAPITIKGSKDAIIKGGGNARVIEINHNYIVLDGFTVDGLHNSPTKEGFRDKLIYILGKKNKGVTGIVIRGMKIQNAGGECIRLRYFARKNEISNNTIQTCGVYDFRFKAGGKNGEGIYIGTAPEQRGDGKNPTADIDKSDNNRIYGNVIDTQGNECVDIKEGSSGNIVENNRCTGQKDPDSGGMDSRGNKNIFRNNEISGSKGAGIRLGGDTEKDGIRNFVYGNVIKNNESGGIKLQREPQEKICGNIFFGNGEGDCVGKYGGNEKLTEFCK